MAITRRSRCRHILAYELSDVRWKCRACGHRYTQATAWTASRLTDGTERRLLEGVLAYRQRFRGLASTPAIERFYRLVRDIRRDHNWQGSAWQTKFGGSRQSHSSVDIASNGQGKVFAVPAPKGN